MLIHVPEGPFDLVEFMDEILECGDVCIVKLVDAYWAYVAGIEDPMDGQMICGVSDCKDDALNHLARLLTNRTVRISQTRRLTILPEFK